MNSNRCWSCGFLNFTTASCCKRCKAEFEFAANPEYTGFTMAPQAACQTVASWPQPEYQSPYAPPSYFGGPLAPLPRTSKYGATNAVLWTLLAVTLVIAFAIGVVWRFNATGSAKLNWQQYQSKDNSFSAMMPAKPLESIERRASPVGELQMHLSYATLGQDGACLVGYADYPDNFRSLSPDSVLNAGANGAVTNSGATLLSQKKITLDGYPGLELEMQPPKNEIPGGGRAVSRIYWVAPRIYITFAGGPTSANTDAMIAKFHESFKIKRRP